MSEAQVGFFVFFCLDNEWYIRARFLFWKEQDDGLPTTLYPFSFSPRLCFLPSPSLVCTPIHP